MLKLRISGIEEESIVDGPGIRYVIFTQGCKHNCKGCHNPETHDFSGGELLTDKLVNKILTDIKNNKLLDGITLSGGDPLEQSEGCYKLIKLIKETLKETKRELNIMIYTGYTIDEIRYNIQNNPEKYKYTKKLLTLADTLVEGRFVQESRNISLKFVGSTNQKIINLKTGGIC